jgi:hypothetical protein
MKTRAGIALALALGVALLAAGAVGVAALYARVGRTPTEIVAYAKVRLQGHPTLERAAVPALDAIRGWFGGADEDDRSLPFSVPPVAPNPAYQVNGSVMTVTTSSETFDPNVIRVGARRSITSLSAAARVAKDGNVVEIDAGDYVADVAVWDRSEITIRGMGNRVRLIASGAGAEGKGIWVIRRGKVLVEGIDFIGARVPDRNGAGIRLESGDLTIRRCLFYDNENGIMTGNDAGTRLLVENSEFGYNGAGDGYSHNIYVGRIQSLKVTGSYFHHANVGHLIKSRAKKAIIEYNRLTDETGGRASYELDLPNGGVAQVVANIIQQGPQARNSVMISYGSEGYVWPESRIVLVHNTVVNDLPLGGTFLRVAAGAESVLSRNNLFVGKGLVDVDGKTDSAGDRWLDWSYFVQAAREDYRLVAKARDSFAAQSLAGVGAELVPRAEYAHSARLKKLAGPPNYPGALQTPGS